MKKILFVIMVSMLTVVGCTKTSSSEVLIEYRRSGGFLGMDDHLVIKENREATLTRRSERFNFTLNSDTINHLQTLFEEAEFSQLRKKYLPSHQGNDFFEYTVTYRGHTVQIMGGAVPPASLQPILETLNQIIENQDKKKAERPHLSVHVVYLSDKTPVTGATVEIVSLSENASNDSNGRVVARRSLNDEGWAFFRLPTGRYLARMRSGYTGQTNFDLEEDKEVVLKVIPVLR